MQRLHPTPPQELFFPKHETVGMAGGKSYSNAKMVFPSSQILTQFYNLKVIYSRNDYELDNRVHELSSAVGYKAQTGKCIQSELRNIV